MDNESVSRTSQLIVKLWGFPRALFLEFANLGDHDRSVPVGYSFSVAGGRICLGYGVARSLSRRLQFQHHLRNLLTPCPFSRV